MIKIRKRDKDFPEIRLLSCRSKKERENFIIYLILVCNKEYNLYLDDNTLDKDRYPASIDLSLEGRKEILDAVHSWNKLELYK